MEITISKPEEKVRIDTLKEGDCFAAEGTTTGIVTSAYPNEGLLYVVYLYTYQPPVIYPMKNVGFSKVTPLGQLEITGIGSE